jgi:comEA protein
MDKDAFLHAGWRRIVGMILILFGVGSGVFYSVQLRQSPPPVAQVTPTPNVVVTHLPAAPKPDPVEPSPQTSSSGRISLSTATQAELETLPGIGAKKAQQIIDYRDTHGFASIDDLGEVEGIGEKTVEQLKPLIDL